MNVATLAALLRERAAMPMERFDDPVTDRDVRLAEVQSYLATASATTASGATIGLQPPVARPGIAGSFWLIHTSGRRSWPLFLAGSRDVNSAPVASSLIHALEWVGVRGVPAG